MHQWPGFSFSVERISELISAGMQLVRRCGGEIDYRGFCRVNLFWPQARRYSCVEVSDWRKPDADPRVGLFFWGVYRPDRPRSRFRHWSWQTPRDRSAVIPENFSGKIAEVTDWEIAYVIRCLGQSGIISREAFDRAVAPCAP